MKGDVSSETDFPRIPSTVASSCLVKGFNVVAWRNITIVKSRIGVVSNETICPHPSPFFVRGVGFGLSLGFPYNITCGEIYSNDDKPVVFPAFCKIYIQ